MKSKTGSAEPVLLPLSLPHPLQLLPHGGLVHMLNFLPDPQILKHRLPLLVR